MILNMDAPRQAKMPAKHRYSHVVCVLTTIQREHYRRFSGTRIGQSFFACIVRHRIMQGMYRHFPRYGDQAPDTAEVFEDIRRSYDVQLARPVL